MREYLVLVKRELKAVRKEKTILFAIFIQLFIASFSSVMLIGVMSFYDPHTIGENSKAEITVGAVGHIASPIVDFVDEARNIEVRSYPSLEAAKDAFRSGQVDAIMEIPPPHGGAVDMDLYLPRSDAQSTVILMSLSEPLKQAENYLREENGIRLNYSNIQGKSHTSYEFLYSVIIPLLMFFPALIAGSIVIDTVSEEIENKTLDTLWSAPISINRIFSAKVCAAVLIAGIQCILWVLLLRMNGYAIENTGLVLMLAVSVAATVAGGAAIIGLCLKDRERAQFVYSIALVLAAGLSYLLDPSPFGLVTRLAAGSPFVGPAHVAVYLAPPVLVAVALHTAISRRWVVAQ